MALKRLDVNTAMGFVEEARMAARDWRAESWRDCEMYDGDQWSKMDLNKADEQGIDPLTINRIFPAVNLILGSQAANRQDIIAKARTSRDGAIAEVVTEGIKFVLDQNHGQFEMSSAFRDSVIPGIGWMHVGINPDPREEIIKVSHRDWKEIWWDPFASPWLDPDECRYMFHQRWMDLEVLMGLFPEKAKDIERAYQGMTSHDTDYLGAYDDEADDVEQEKRALGSPHWIDPERKRVRPVELWYPLLQDCLFALFDDGRCIELTDDMAPTDQFQLMVASGQVVKAKVRKMQTMTFLGREVLQHSASPHGHDLYPFVPFVGYLDRYSFPYGVPRQIRGQNEEVNKRRSMALALLQKRRVIIEEGASDNLDVVHEELNAMDGLVVLKENGLNKVKVVEGADLAVGQTELMRAAENEIQQISGANNEAMGYHAAAQSGRALENKQRQASTVLATLFDNSRRSQARLGSLVCAEMQDKWKGSRVLRIVDNVTNAERFVEVNQPVQTAAGQIEVKNDITQGRYDIVITDAPMADTTREQSLNMLIEWVKQSPPEIIPHLMSFALELSNLPNKEALLMRLRPLLGQDPLSEDMSPEEIKEQIVAKMEAEQATATQQKQIEERMLALEMQAKELENQKLQAEIQERLAAARKHDAEVYKKHGDTDRSDYLAGHNIGREMAKDAREGQHPGQQFPPVPMT